MNCNFCHGEMECKINAEILVPVGNPKKVKIKANFFRCINCGKELFERNESIRVSEIIDNINLKLESGEKVDLIEVEEGKIIY